MRAAVFTKYDEPLEIAEIDEPTPDPGAVVFETVSLGGISEHLAAMNGYERVESPVITAFYSPTRTNPISWWYSYCWIPMFYLCRSGM